MSPKIISLALLLFLALLPNMDFSQTYNWQASREKTSASKRRFNIYKIILFLTLIILLIRPGIATTNITGCANLDQPGETYLLTADIINSSTSYCINISANDVTLDCQGHLIDGDDNADYGIWIYRDSEQTTNITVKNCIVKDWDGANIYIERADYNTFENITSISSPGAGIEVQSYTRYNVFNNINASGNNYGIMLDGWYADYHNLTNITANNNRYGIYLVHAAHNRIINATLKENEYYDLLVGGNSESHCDNTIENVTGSNDLPILYYNSAVNLSDMEVSELILCNADYSNINNITINGSQTYKNNMLRLVLTEHANLSNIYSSNNYYGIQIDTSDYNTFSNIIVNSNYWHGLYILYSDYNTFFNVTANSNQIGVHLFVTSSHNTFSNLTANSNSEYGILIRGNSDYNVIANSTIANNGDAGLYLEKVGASEPEYNKIYNCLFNNSVNVKIDSGIPNPNYFNTTKRLGTRIYSNGNYIGGNYWSNPTGTGYSDTCDDADNDGFCDDPFILAENNTDYLPLTWIFKVQVDPKNPPTEPLYLQENKSYQLFNFSIGYPTIGKITEINITLPEGITFVPGSQFTSAQNTIFVKSGNSLIWKNTTADGFIGKDESFNFGFKANLSSAGNYTINITFKNNMGRVNSVSYTYFVKNISYNK